MKIFQVLTVFLGLTFITGVLYPALVTGIAQIAFPKAATGMLITENGKIVGSELIGQSFVGQDMFWGRPSATSPVPYSAASGAGSNLALSNPALSARIAADTERIVAAHGGKMPVPVDLVTTSGSGLDPHISVAAANYQIERVAKARGISRSKLEALVARFTEEPTFGVLGEKRVNVLMLNLALKESVAQP